MKTRMIEIYECEGCHEEFEDRNDITKCEYCGADICENCGIYGAEGRKSECSDCSELMSEIVFSQIGHLKGEGKKRFLEELTRQAGI